MKFINAALLALIAPLASAAQTPLNNAADALIAVSVGTVAETMTYDSAAQRMSLNTGNDESTADAAGAAALAAAVGGTLTVTAPKIILTLHGSLTDGTWGEHFEDPISAVCVITGENTVAAITLGSGADVGVYGTTTSVNDVTTFDELEFLQDNDLRGFFGGIDGQTTGGDDFNLVSTCGQQAITATTDGRINLCITTVTTLEDSAGNAGTEITTYEDFLDGDGDGYHFMEQNCMELTFTESIDGIDFDLEVNPIAHETTTVSTSITHTPQLKVTLCQDGGGDVNLGESFCLNADVYGLPTMYWWTCHRTEAAGIMSIATGQDSATNEGHCEDNFHVEIAGSDSPNDAIVSGGKCSINAALAGAGDVSTCDARTLYYQPSQAAATGGTEAADSSLNGELFRFRVSLIVRLPTVLDHPLVEDEGIDVNVKFDAGAWTTTVSGSLDS